MLEIVLMIVFGLFVLVLLFNFYWLLCGFMLLDWVLVLDIMYINIIGLIVLYGIVLDSKFYFEVVMLIVLIGFVSIVVVVKYMLCGDIIE